MRKTVTTVSLRTIAFALVHSLLATTFIKSLFKRRYGERAFDGSYRLLYNVVALVSFGALLRGFSRLPDRTLYRVRWPWSLPMRTVQILSLLLVVDANIRIGIGRMTGVEGAWQLLTQHRPIHQNPAQGPQLEGDVAFRTGGSFRLSRHPNNLAPFLLFIFQPEMGLRFLAFTLVGAAYLILGSIHEEKRLRAVYGRKYERYRVGKPFFLPGSI